MLSLFLAIDSYGLTAVVILAYLLFYTAFDKTKGSLSMPLLLDVLLFKRGVDWTLVEINKVLGLAGITTMLLYFIPKFSDHNMLFSSLLLLWSHSMYSMYKFYQWDIRKIINEKVVKRVALVFGSIGLALLTFDSVYKITWLSMGLSSTFLGVAHFWGMEVDYKYRLQVRPFAYLPFVLAPVVLYALLVRI